MTSVPIYQVDAFTKRPFAGNPAAVMPLMDWLDDETLLAIAVENNLSETAFFLERDAFAGAAQLRWFTPGGEVDLCGHATLASAHIIFTVLNPALEHMTFQSNSGPLVVTRGDGGAYVMDFPNLNPAPAELPEGALAALGGEAQDTLVGMHQGEADRDFLVVYETEAEVRGLSPDFTALAAAGRFGFIATAPGETVDFVSRCFFPAYNIDEDPVTGSAHCVSGPYWAARLGKGRLAARQISPRGGDVMVEINGDRVNLSGHAVTVMTGEFRL